MAGLCDRRSLLAVLIDKADLVFPQIFEIALRYQLFQCYRAVLGLFPMWAKIRLNSLK